VNHTKTPWQYEIVGVSSVGPDGFDVAEIQTVDGYKRIAECLSVQDAEYIVQACNSHDDLIATLQKIHANAAESADWIRMVIDNAIAKVTQ